MEKQQLVLYKTQSGNLRSVIKTSHGRIIYLEISKDDDSVSVINCYYLDRKNYCVPKKLITTNFNLNEMLDVIATELDRKYYGIEFTDKFADLSKDEFITIKLKNTKYNFLIFVGEGELINGIPSVIKTRFKNKIHRSIYLEMQYYNGKGVITDCRFFDRKYKAKEKVIPETLTTVFFDYNRQAILNIINNELNTSFTHIIFVIDGSLDSNNEVVWCGNV